MRRRDFLKTTALAAGAATMLSESHAAPPKKPNLVFILTDDLGMGDVGCYGQKLIKTPHMDRMAAEGARFTQAYSGTSVCAPSRSSLMTGLHMGNCPIRANREIKPEGQMPLPEGTVTVAQLLKKEGYATACMGKWGMGMFHTSGSPLKVGFDHFYGYNCQRHAHTYFPSYLYDDDKRIKLEPRTYATELIQQDVEKWVRSVKDEPFFLFYAATLPHGRYEIDKLGEYENREGWSKLQKTYAAMITRLDSDLGRLLALLKELGVDENALVFICGDNGSSFNPNSEIGRLFDQTMGGKLRGIKRSMYEGALRQAAIARWPGRIPAGRVSDGPWAFWDFLPTAVELAGAKLPDGFHTDGLSLVKMLEGGPAPKRDHFYWELHEGRSIQAIRFGDWKAVKNGPSAKTELYDLKNDEGEKKNLAAEKPDLVVKAEALMKKVRTEDANWPLRDRRVRKPKPKPKKKPAK